MYERDTILKDLREHVIEVHFQKVNGEERVMRCTLRRDLLPPQKEEDVKEEKKFHSENTDVIAAWDVQKGGWRSFRVDSVTIIQDVNDNY